MGKRFYCDYCDRLFPYSVEGRQRHINGHHHQKLKKLHYDKFKNPQIRLQDELSKEKCRRFHTGQECTYGDTCMYSHATAADFAELKQKAADAEDALRISKLPSQVLQPIEPTLKDWLEKYKHEETDNHKIIEVSNSSSTFKNGEDVAQYIQHHFKFPPELENISNLPPSLIPMTLDELLDCSFDEWG
ncbi:unnamed protein product [Meganyctiphanes norvegica]|uniref:C3H1-type domain-containing protein n=1 Tax=Meganyctiphanes norvegica TaxID=48144 RepID=A0AAV2REN1_MEGNR